MTDMLIMLVLVAAILGYISVLLYYRLGSLGVSPGHVVRVIVELWVTFAVITALFSVIAHLVGPVAGLTPADQVAAQWARVHTLPAAQQGMVFVGALLALALFLHFLWSWQSLQRDAERAETDSDKEMP